MPFVLNMPKLSPTMEAGMIAKWHKKEGDFVEAGELLLEVATDKATIEYNALDEGFLRKILVEEGKEADINQPIAIFTEQKEEDIEGFLPEKEEKAEERVEEPKIAEKVVEERKESVHQPRFVPEEPLEDYTFEWPTATVEKRIKASPVAKKLARELGLDLATVKGSGPGGRIVKEDLKMAQKAGVPIFGKKERPEIPPGTYEEIDLTPMRKVIAKRLREAKTFIPHFYVQQRVDAVQLVSVKEQLGAFNIKLSYNDFVLRACALALREYPLANRAFNSEKQKIVQFKTVDIAVAVGLEGGLITPIIHHADYKNIAEISIELKNLVRLAKEGKLEEWQYRGGSFTVSNLGMFNITNFQAILNPPQAAILALGGIREVPVVKDGRLAPGKIMDMTLSSDHRIIDGIVASEFLNIVKRYLENPALLLI